MVGNLAPLIPALFTGPNGERLTADQIKRRQDLANEAMAFATDTSPNAGGVASILAKGLAGFRAGWEDNKANRALSTNAAESQKRLSSMLGIFTGGAPASSTTPSIGGLPPAVSTGAGAELAATSPSVATNIDMSGNELYSSFIDTVRQGGLTNPYGLAAVAATGKAESGWSPQNATRTWSDPSESGQPGTAGGIMSWRGPRYQALAATGDLSPQGQARFFLQEDPNLIAKLNSAKSLEEAQSAINQAWAFAGYDRPGGEAARRLSYAQGYLPMFQGQGEVAALMPQGAIEAVAPTSGGQPPAFDAGRFGDPINLAEMPPSASTLPSSLIDQGSNYVPAPPMTSPPREVAAAPSVAQALVQPSAPAPAPAPTPVGAQPSVARPQINPVVIEALTSPYSSPEERQVAQMLFSDFQQEKDRAEKQALAQQQRAAEIARRQAIAQQTGIDPSYAADDDIWKGAAGNLFAAPSTSTVNGAVIDNRTGQPIYQAPVDPQTYSGYAAYEQSQGRTPLGPLEYEQALRRSGASQTNVDTGTIPPGYRVVRDENGRVTQYEPIPGGPAATDAATLERTTERQAGARETASRVVTDAATRALEAMQAPGLPATGVAGGAMSWLPESNAAELRRQVDVLKSNATVENLNAMRAASPTGGALGSVTEKEGAMLAAKSGTLDPNSPNFARDVKDYTRTLLEVTHGPKVGKEIFDKMRWPGQTEEAEEAPPPDVDPEDWKFMSPEDRALFK